MIPYAGDVGGASARWLHDGSGFLVRVPEAGQAGPAFHFVDLKSGRFERRFAVDTADHRRSGIGDLSPDDKTLYLFTGSKSREHWTGIVGVNPSTGEQRPIVTFPGDGLRGNGLALSPDGSTLALMVWAEGSPSQARIITVGVDGTGYRELHGPFPAQALADKMRWTPDGRSILFISAATSGWRVMRVPADGGRAEPDGLDSTTLSGSVPLPRLAAGTATNIDLNPDGSRIVFTAFTLPTIEIWALENVLAVLSARR